MIDDIKLNVLSNAFMEFLRDKLKLNSSGNQLLSMIVLNLMIWINHNTDTETIKHILFVILQPRYLIIAFVCLAIYLNKNLIRELLLHRFGKKIGHCNNDISNVIHKEEEGYIIQSTKYFGWIND